MNIVELPLALLRFQYEIARLPLSVLEQQVFARMDSEAPVRLFYERSLGMLDSTVGHALRVPAVQRRGAALIERSDSLRRAAQLDAAATQNVKQADSKLQHTRETATRARDEAHKAKERQVKKAREDAQSRKRAAVDAAEKRIGAGKRQAEDVAAQRKTVVEEVKHQEQARSQAAEQAVAAAAEAKLTDAQQKRNHAASERAQADRIVELADAEKHRTDPANDA